MDGDKRGYYRKREKQKLTDKITRCYIML